MGHLRLPKKVNDAPRSPSVFPRKIPSVPLPARWAYEGDDRPKAGLPGEGGGGSEGEGRRKEGGREGRTEGKGERGGKCGGVYKRWPEGRGGREKGREGWCGGCGGVSDAATYDTCLSIWHSGCTEVGWTHRLTTARAAHQPFCK